MTNAPDPKQIADFLSNKGSYAHAEEVYAWLESHPGELDKVLLTEDLRDDERVTVPGAVKKKILNRALGRPVATIIYLKRWAVAAAIAGLVLASLWLFRTENREPEAVATVTVKNTTGALMNYRLPDGSALSLMPGAAIVFAKGFLENRLVTVAGGNVYFRVKKDGRHPFRVMANNISTTAVGTEFWVQQLTGQRLNVALKEGKVFIHTTDKYFRMDTVFLLPGQNCTIDKATGLVRVWATEEAGAAGAAAPAGKSKTSGAGNAIVWTNREIALSNATLLNVFTKLEHRYNVKIIAQDTGVYHATITGKIFYNDSLEVLMAAICELNQLSYEKSNDTIFLKRK